jgi:hypothetical protein
MYLRYLCAAASRRADRGWTAEALREYEAARVDGAPRRESRKDDICTGTYE